MNTSGDAAEQIVRLSLEGTEVALKITGAAAKNVAAMLYAVLKEQKKTKGRARVETMLRRNKPMKVYTVRRQDCKEFTQRAKTYGILFCPVPYKKGDDTIDILVDQEDAARVDHIVEKFHLASVDSDSIKNEIERSRSEKAVGQSAGEKAVPEQERPEKSADDLLLDELLDQPAGKEAAAPANPEAAKDNPFFQKGRKSRPSAPTLEPASRTAEGATKQPDAPSGPQRTSVREELKEIREQRKQEAAGPKREETSRSKPKQQKTTRHEQPPRKKKKAKER